MFDLVDNRYCICVKGQKDVALLEDCNVVGDYIIDIDGEDVTQVDAVRVTQMLEESIARNRVITMVHGLYKSILNGLRSRPVSFEVKRLHGDLDNVDDATLQADEQSNHCRGTSSVDDNPNVFTLKDKELKKREAVKAVASSAVTSHVKRTLNEGIIRHANNSNAPSQGREWFNQLPTNEQNQVMIGINAMLYAECMAAAKKKFDTMVLDRDATRNLARGKILHRFVITREGAIGIRCNTNIT